ncbi:hypothetical protein [Olsenella phocaeensis]|uniref:hypothetical protein n=1 Tax=Olsenella phocaeensis TaxID=1852385 RepID=UPI003A8DC8AB
MTNESSTWPRRGLPLAAAALAMALSPLATPVSALAYFSRPAPSIGVPGSMSLASGDSRSVSCPVDPQSESQLPGCGMAECPQACDGLENPSTHVVGGCLSADGWCTCAGVGYYTAYTNVSVSSSDPSVVRASWSGGVLNVTGYRPGSAVVTVFADLSKHESASASFSVSVTGEDPSPAPGPSDEGASPSGPSGHQGGGTSVSPASPGGSGGQGGTFTRVGASGGGSGAGQVSVTATRSAPATIAAAAAVAPPEARDEVEMTADDGHKAVVVRAADAASAAEALAKVAGTDGTCTFWSGGTLEAPSISWMYRGEELSPDANLAVDPAVTVSVGGSGSGGVSRRLAGVRDALVVEFAHPGPLPAPAEFYVRTSGTYEDGTTVGLYVYDEATGRFDLAQGDVPVSGGYATFAADYCAVWVLSTQDLGALASPGDGAVSAREVDTRPSSGLPLLAGAAGVAVAGVAALLVRRRGRPSTEAAGDGGMDSQGPPDAVGPSTDAGELAGTRVLGDDAGRGGGGPDVSED